jgi:aldehyde dehydrogenase (NAD+)
MSLSSVGLAIRNSGNLFVGGEWTAPSSGETIDVLDSTTEEVFLTVAAAQASDVERAVGAARYAFDRGPWPRMSHAQRATWMRKIAAGWEKHGHTLADGWTAESGILRSLSGYASAQCARTFEYYASLADTFPWQEKHSGENGEPALLVREPVGVVAAIIPWNAPSALMCYKVATALIAGCTVILKASPEAPSSSYLLAQICEEIGLPAGVINVFTAQREESELLVRNQGVDKVSFTGSTAAGRKIASICGERIARCTLELGGKSPAVILDDYDVGKAAQSIATFAPLLSGQVCSSLTRIIVPERRHDQFVEALNSAFGGLKVGDPSAADTQLGPLASEAARARVEGLIAQAKTEGTKLVTGGGRPSHLNRGYFIEPTIFANVDNRSTIAREEVFGPVLCVIPAKSEAEAIDMANDTIYGLNASVFTNDPDRAYDVGRQLRAGTVGHNSFKSDFSIGFGGFKQSGLGREGGTEGLHAFLESKTMIFETSPTGS